MASAGPELRPGVPGPLAGEWTGAGKYVARLELLVMAAVAVRFGGEAGTPGRPRGGVPGWGGVGFRVRDYLAAVRLRTAS